MAYQNVGTPRFYIDAPSYLRGLGLKIQEQQLLENYDVYGQPLIENPNGDYSYRDISLFNLDDVGLDAGVITAGTPYALYGQPVPQGDLESMMVQFTVLDESRNFRLSHVINAEKFYFSLINFHVYTGSTGTPVFRNFRISKTDYGDPTANYPNGIHPWGDSENLITDMENIVNIDLTYGEGTNIKNKYGIPNDGFCIATGNIGGLDELSQYNFMGLEFSSMKFLTLGAISFGSYYDMPHSPELDLTMTIENDGYDAITTQGGAHLSNIRYTGAPMWERVDGTKVPPWTIGEPTTPGRRTGRRVWNLKFNYLSDSDLFSSNYMNTNYMQSGSDTGYDSGDIEDNEFYYDLGNDNSFHAQVLNRVGNGQRFIFQPDNTNNNPDQFAICQLDQDSLKIKQVASGVYNIALKIREVW